MGFLEVLREHNLGYTLLAGGTTVLFAIYYTVLIIYRLFFHPLSKIPGPRLAAATWWYEAYWGVWMNGKFPRQYTEDHKKYGPIIRLNPNEVHISDPEFYRKVYSVGSKFDRPEYFYGVFNAPGSMVTCTSHTQHKHLRSIFSPFFSRPSIFQMSHTIQDLVSQLSSRFDTFAEQGEPLEFPAAARALTADAIFKVTTDSMETEKFLGRKDWGRKATEAMGSPIGISILIDMTILPRIFGRPPLSAAPVALLPKRWLRKLGADVLGFWYMKFIAENEVERIVKMSPEELQKRRVEKGGRVIMDEVMCAEARAKAKLPTNYYADELFMILGAGVETTAGVITTAMFHVLNNPDIHEKVYQELKQAFPDKTQEMPFADIEALPYLTAVIREALRVGDSAPGRFPRTVPKGGITYKDYYLPEGTLVGLSAYTQHRDESIFPNPSKFDPDRFLGPEGLKIAGYLVPFSAGSTGCLGKSLAYAEIYIVLGRLFRNYELSIYECDETDICKENIYFAGFHHERQRPLQVFVKKRGE